jgi:hypothetical protein
MLYLTLSLSLALSRSLSLSLFLSLSLSLCPSLSLNSLSLSLTLTLSLSLSLSLYLSLFLSLSLSLSLSLCVCVCVGGYKIRYSVRYEYRVATPNTISRTNCRTISRTNPPTIFCISAQCRRKGDYISWNRKAAIMFHGKLICVQFKKEIGADSYRTGNRICNKSYGDLYGNSYGDLFVYVDGPLPTQPSTTTLHVL